MFCSSPRCFKALGKNCIRVAGHQCSDHLYHSLSCYRQAMKTVEPKLRPSKGVICPRCQAISGSYIHVDFQPEPEVVQDELELGGEEIVETVEMENGDEQSTKNAETGQSSKGAVNEREEREQNMNEQNDDDQSLENEEAEVSSTDDRAGEIENREDDNDGEESTGNEETEVSSEEEDNENEMEQQQQQNQVQNLPLVLQIVAEDQVEPENGPEIPIQTIRGRRILDGEWIHGPRPFNMALICDVCLEELPSTSRKFRHTEKHLEPVMCHLDNCQSFFTREDNLKRHIKTSH